MNEQKSIDFLIWVGTMFYPTIEDFVKELQEQGWSKRIGKKLVNLQIGKSRIFFCHDEGYIGDGVIFGYSTIEKIEIVVRNGFKFNNGVKKYIDAGVEIVDATHEKIRGCGWRDIGGMYFSGSLSAFKLFGKFRNYNKIVEPEAKRFRGIKRFNGNKIIYNTRDLKDAPSKRADKEITIKTTAKLKKSQRWTPENDAKLIEFVDKFVASGKSKNLAFIEFARQTGKTKHGCIYRYYQKTNVTKKDTT